MKNKSNKPTHRRSQLSRRLLLQYAVSMTVFAAAFVIFVLLLWELCGMIVWQADSAMYRMLDFIRDYIVLFGGLVLLIGWAFISCYYISKPLKFLDEIVEASANLANSPEHPIVLPDAVKNIQDELNAARESALRNAAAAKEAEQRKNDLIVYLAHDLKTPLTTVIGYLTLLRDEPEVSIDIRAKYAGIALDKAERLEILINEFFDIARFNLTQMTLDEETINLTRMLEQISHEFNQVLFEKNLTWNMNLEPDIQITCDPDKLQRVFDNLFLNAVNYSYENTDINVSMVQNGENIVVKIVNKGKTIPQEKLHRIFEQFFRLDTSRSTSTGGAGLGLAIAKEIVELHGGTITVEGENEYITFVVTLPHIRQKNV